MKTPIGFTAFAATILFGWQSHAVSLHVCEPAPSIIARADDEICDHFVDASEDCFAKLNERLALLAARSAKTPPKDVLTEAEPIKESYEAGVVVVHSYLQKMDQKNCGNQRARVKVMIDELNTDLKDVSSRITRVKAR